MRRRFLQALSHGRRGAGESRASPATSFRSTAELELERQARERRARILTPSPPALLPPPPAWISPEAVLGWPSAEGFVPLAEAAARMELDEEQVLELVDRGWLRARGYGSRYVQPAIVTGVHCAPEPTRES